MNSKDMEKKVTLNDRTFKVMIPAEEIDAAIGRVAAKLNQRYRSAENPPVFVCVLKGAVMFLTDLIRKVEFNNELAFIRISSYSGTSSTGKIQLHMGLDMDIKGRDVIVVEDIVETGDSIDFMVNYLKEKGPKSIAICSLFFKPERYRYNHKIDYPAMEIGNAFIVGFGLDYDQLGRNLKDIYVLDA